MDPPGKSYTQTTQPYQDTCGVSCAKGWTLVGWGSQRPGSLGFRAFRTLLVFRVQGLPFRFGSYCSAHVAEVSFGTV